MLDSKTVSAPAHGRLALTDVLELTAASDATTATDATPNARTTTRRGGRHSDDDDGAARGVCIVSPDAEGVPVVRQQQS